MRESRRRGGEEEGEKRGGGGEEEKGSERFWEGRYVFVHLSRML